RISRLIVGGVDQNAFFGFDSKSHAALRMIEPGRLDLDAVAHWQASVLYVVEASLRALHVVHADGKIRRSHLLAKYLFQTPGAARRVERKLTVGTGIKRAEKRHTLNMVPMEM